MRLTVDLGDEQLEAIARRAAELVLAELREAVPAADVSPYMSVKQAKDYIAADDVQRIYDLQSSGRLSRFKEGGRTLCSRAELEALVVADRVARSLPTASRTLSGSGVSA